MPKDSITLEEIRDWRPKPKSASIIHISSLTDSFVSTWKSKPENIFGVPTSKWLKFNKYHGGMRHKELVVLTADTGLGKTTFAMNLMLDLANQDRGVFLASLEIDIETIFETLAGMISGKSIRDMTKNDVTSFLLVAKDLPIWALDHHGLLDEGLLIKAIEYAAEEKKCEFMLVDHLDYIVKARNQVQSEAYVVGDTMRRISGTARKTNTGILLIAHPAKLQEKGAKTREVGLDELKGSSSIKQEADSVWGLHRPNMGEATATLRFLKIRNRHFGMNRNQVINFVFDPPSGRMEESDD